MPRGQMTDVQKTAARARADARTIVVEGMKAPDFPAAVRTALQTLNFRPAKRRGAGTGMVEQLNQLTTLLGAGPVPHMKAYEQFRLGPQEMNARIRVFLNTRRGSNRIWVRLNADKASKTYDCYEIVARGDKIPPGWTGYIPDDLKPAPTPAATPAA